MWYVYLLQSLKDRSWYIGCTNDLKARIKEHNSGKSKFTKAHLPYRLIYYEACLDRKDAFKREKYLKSGYGRRWLKKRFKYYLGT
jgi:putative endonuclease